MKITLSLLNSWFCVRLIRLAQIQYGWVTCEGGRGAAFTERPLTGGGKGVVLGRCSRCSGRSGGIDDARDAADAANGDVGARFGGGGLDAFATARTARGAGMGAGAACGNAMENPQRCHKKSNRDNPNNPNNP